MLRPVPGTENRLHRWQLFPETWIAVSGGVCLKPQRQVQGHTPSRRQTGLTTLSALLPLRNTQAAALLIEFSLGW